ncbi:hypothetical protein [Crossiella sp. NPDC003009]
MPNASAVSGPAWTEPTGTPGVPRYPLNVEAPVLAALERLLPGISPPSGSGPEWLTLTGRHPWPAEDRPRRASLRMLARAAQLLPEAEDWQEAAEQAIAYDAYLAEDPLLRGLEVAATWRGVLLRRHSVDAWRRWWAALAGHPDPHELTTESLPDVTVAAFAADLPAHTDAAGHPAPAELSLRLAPVPGALATLLIGAQRAETLRGKAKIAFLGQTGVYLDPGFVAHRAESARGLRALGRTLVADMLAQARRIGVRRNQPPPRDARPDASPIPLHLNTLGRLAQAENLFSATEDDGLGVTPLGARLLEVSP